ncbi:MAG: hypothetical protein GEU80_12075 [Dehalococcoidia bacterium]|nr:hypothetical protein [Dehalococcoidia bacterium]
MADQDARDDLFDEEPEEQREEHSSNGDQPLWLSGVNRRRFLATAGGAAAGGAVLGVAGGFGIAPA